jgi:hypothetical protein
MDWDTNLDRNADRGRDTDTDTDWKMERTIFKIVYSINKETLFLNVKF